MSIKNTFILFALVIVLILAVGCTQSAQVPSGQQQAPPAPNITMIVPFGPIPVESMNGVNIAYELEFRGAGNMTVKPEKVEVIDAATGTVLYTPNASVLAKTSYPAVCPAADSVRIAERNVKTSLPTCLHLVCGQPGCRAGPAHAPGHPEPDL